MPCHPSPPTLSTSISSSSVAHHRALVSASRTENEMCDTLLKVGMEIPFDSHLDAVSELGREDVVCLTHHLEDDLGGRCGASNRPHPFACRIGHRLPVTAGVGCRRHGRPDRKVIGHVYRVWKQARSTDSGVLLRFGITAACCSVHGAGGKKPVGLVGPFW